MATLMRFATRQTFRVFSSTYKLAIQPKFAPIQPSLSISTSKKNKDSVSVSDSALPTNRSVDESLGDKEENWISYDYNLYDRDNDEWQHHIITFSACFALCWGCFMMAYFPDMKNEDWTQREAYLELARREKEGLPLVDRNLIPADQLQLPTEEELIGVEIII